MKDREYIMFIFRQRSWEERVGGMQGNRKWWTVLGKVAGWQESGGLMLPCNLQYEGNFLIPWKLIHGRKVGKFQVLFHQSFGHM